jgi:hypothetical protein
MKLSPNNSALKYSKESPNFLTYQISPASPFFCHKKPLFRLFSAINTKFNCITSIKVDFYLIKNIKLPYLNFFRYFMNKNCNYYCYEY